MSPKEKATALLSGSDGLHFITGKDVQAYEVHGRSHTTRLLTLWIPTFGRTLTSVALEAVPGVARQVTIVKRCKPKLARSDARHFSRPRPTASTVSGPVFSQGKSWFYVRTTPGLGARA